MPKQNGPTINDLARHLGVNKSTVSRAMDPARRHLIGKDLLQRVDQAARELGYRANRMAAALATGRSKMVGVVLSNIGNPAFSSLLKGITDALEVEGYIALVASTSRAEGDVRSPQVVIERMQSHCVDGFLVAAALLDDPWLDNMGSGGAPVVLVNRTDGRGRLPAVLNDNPLSMRLAVDHLVGLGHTRIGHLAGPSNMSTGRSRREGLEQALRAHGLVPGPIVECSTYSVEAGQVAMAALLAGVRPARGRTPALERPTAVIAANDMIALGALLALKQQGISVPRQMSLVGHNDMPFLDQTDPPLTTVRIQNYEIGYQAARLLMGSLAAGSASNGGTTIVLEPQLVVRGSTAPAPKAP